MKNIFSILGLILTFTTSFGQSIHWDKHYNYSLHTPDRQDELTVNLFNDKEAKYSFLMMQPNYLGNFLLHNNQMLLINVEPFTNKLVTNTEYLSYYNQDISNISSTFSQKLVFEKMDLPATKVNDFSCEPYMATIAEDDTSNNLFASSYIFACIDTKSKDKNLKTVFSNSNIDGLLVTFGINSDENVLQLNEINTVQTQSKFDFAKEYADLEELIIKDKAYTDSIYTNQYYYDEEVIDAAMMGNNVYNTPICSHYNYDASDKVDYYLKTFSSDICGLMMKDSDYDGTFDLSKNEIEGYVKSQVKNYPKSLQKAKFISKDEAKQLKNKMQELWDESKYYAESSDDTASVAVEAAASAVAAEAYYDDFFEQYVSTYKKENLNDISLAIDNFENANALKAIPTHCQTIKNDLPNFENTELKTILHNYVGQICDLYFLEVADNVYMKATIDAVRKSILELDRIYPSLNKKDKQKLTEYLNQLD